MRNRSVLAMATVFVLGVCSVAFAIPKIVNYQGVLQDSSGEPIATTTDILFAIWNDPVAGDSLWSETQSVTPDALGLFNVLLGSVSPIPDTAFIGDVYLSMTVSTDPELSPRTRLVSVPFAYRPATIDGATGGMIDGELDVTGTNNRIRFFYNDVSDLPSPTTYDGMFAHVHNDANAYYAHGGQWVALADQAHAHSSLDASDGSPSPALSMDASGNMTVVGKATIGPNQTNTGLSAFVAGENNRARGLHSVVSGGGGFGGTGDSNLASGDVSVIAGGTRNVAGGYATTVSGGYDNFASGTYATIGGGDGNEASAARTTVSGGSNNGAGSDFAFVGGGNANLAYGNRSAIAGGGLNLALGSHAAIPGGFSNLAGGRNSLAAGGVARAVHDGAVVLAANSSTVSSDSVWSTADEQMVLRADGQFYLTNASGGASTPAGRFLNTSTGAYLSTGGTWTNSSDRNAKENLTPVNANELLDQIARLNVFRWNYKADNSHIQHIGPTAQEFYRLFQVGSDSISIATVDPDGIALAAIQELIRRNEELRSIVTKQQEQINKLSELVNPHSTPR